MLKSDLHEGITPHVVMLILLHDIPCVQGVVPILSCNARLLPIGTSWSR